MDVWESREELVAYVDALAVQLHNSLQVEDPELQDVKVERRDKEMFEDLGEVFNAIARLWDKGIRHVVVQNSAHVKSAINIRVRVQSCYLLVC